MLAGAASAALVLLVLLLASEMVNERAAARRRTISMHQRAAERAMEEKVQQTISEMLRSARGGGLR